MTDPDGTLTSPPARRKASPGYPALDLRAAIDRTVDLYKASPNHPVALPTAAELWGFSPKSSSSKVAAAALKRYGLVRDVGGGGARQLALTEAGREVAFQSDDRDDGRWSELLRDAALAPRIHRQVLDHFGLPLPDRRVVLRYLLFELGFQDESTAADFIKRLDTTLRFAGVDSLDQDDAAAGLPVALTSPTPTGVRPDSDRAKAGAVPEFLGAQQNGSEQATDTTDGSAQGTHGRPSVPASDQVYRAPEAGPAERHEPLRPPTPSIYDHFASDRQVVQIPYSNGQWASLTAAFPMSEAEWTMMMGVLNAMKPGLVEGIETVAAP